MNDAVIVAATRTPIGRAFKGSLVSMRPDDLSAGVIKAALEKVPALDPSTVEDVILGCAQPAGESGYNMARVASLLAGLKDVPGTTVNRYCASSLQAMRMAYHAIRAGEGDVFVAAGVETVSRFERGKSDGMPDTKNPRLLEEASGLPNVYLAMGETAERVAAQENVTRQEMDEFACLSQERASQAVESGVFEREISPVTLPDGAVISRDDCPRPNTTVEKLSGLKPVFREDGRVTAGNACPLNDGAAAVVIMSDRRAKELGIPPLARILSTGLSALRPEVMGLGPVDSSRQALARAGLSINDVDLVELNEAFAAQVIPSAKQLEVDWDRLNVHGGAIALGHPFGMTGARMMVTLLNALETTDGTLGLETLCVGGGQGMAMLVERL
jgi:acetyl-CoA C-acetyltransferase